MSKSEVAVPDTGIWAEVSAAATPAERRAKGRWAIEAVELPTFHRPVPRFFLDLPWVTDNEAVVDEILAGIAAADDIEAATDQAELRDPADLCGQTVTLLDVVVRRSEVDDARWGAYLSLTASVDGAEPEILNTGAGQVCVTVWRLYVEGKFPARGTFVKLGAEVKGRSQPLGFRVFGEL